MHALAVDGEEIFQVSCQWVGEEIFQVSQGSQTLQNNKRPFKAGGPMSASETCI